MGGLWILVVVVEVVADGDDELSNEVNSQLQFVPSDSRIAKASVGSRPPSSRSLRFRLPLVLWSLRSDRVITPTSTLAGQTIRPGRISAFLEISRVLNLRVLVLISLLSTELRLTRCTPSANRQAAERNSNLGIPYSCGVMPAQATPK